VRQAAVVAAEMERVQGAEMGSRTEAAMEIFSGNRIAQ